MPASPRVLIVTYDVIGPVMAGPGIRAWEFARVLGGLFPTTLAAPPPIPMDTPGFTMAEFPLGPLEKETLARLIGEHDIIIAQVLPLYLLPDDILKDKYFIVDLYCPGLVENLEYYRTEEAKDPTWLVRDLETMSAHFAHGDFFVCAGEAQRAYWLGALSAFGRLTEEIYARDVDGRALIDIVPFGLPAAPPEKSGAAMRGVIPGIGPEDFVALWGGGIWNWLDPLTLIRATARLRDRGYPIRTFFLGTQRPAVSEVAKVRTTMLDRARQLSDDLDLTGSHVFFNDRWVPYNERANYLLEADVGISLHQPTLETRFSFRTRVLDYLWAGLVPVVNDGDTIADLVRTNDVGTVVPIGDDEALAVAIATLIDHPAERRRLSARCRVVAESYTWEAAARPIIDICRQPWRGQRASRVEAMHLYDDVGKLREMLHETSWYAQRLEREIAARDEHIARLEPHVASPTLRSFVSARIRKTPLRHLADRIRRR
jgi:glycosyltransferase involved in cell wall biosynthesis